LVEQVAHTNNRKTVYTEFLSNSTFLYIQNSLVTAHSFMSTDAVAK